MTMLDTRDGAIPVTGVTSDAIEGEVNQEGRSRLWFFYSEGKNENGANEETNPKYKLKPSIGN